MKKVIRAILILVVIGAIGLISYKVITAKHLEEVAQSEKDIIFPYVNKDEINIYLEDYEVIDSNEVDFRIMIENHTGGAIASIENVDIEVDFLGASIGDHFDSLKLPDYFGNNSAFSCVYTLYTSSWTTEDIKARQPSLDLFQLNIKYDINVDSSYVFGSYPSKAVANPKEYGLDTIKFDSTWTAYGFYSDGKVESFIYYKDVDTDSDGNYDFRGVYSTKYRPVDTTMVANADYDPLKGNLELECWYFYKPILWDIIGTDEEETKALLFSRNIVDFMDFNSSADKSSILTYTYRTANNYAHSHIRNWLNDTFYNDAFSDSEKKRILETEIDNSKHSIPENTSGYVTCENTKDKIFLLSIGQVSDYYSSVINLKAKRTQYASAMNDEGKSYTEVDYYYSNWWLRSGFWETWVDTGSTTHLSRDTVTATNIGVRPACWITL